LQASCKFVLPASFSGLTGRLRARNHEKRRRETGLRPFSPDSARARLRDIQLSKSQYGDTPGHTPVLQCSDCFTPIGPLDEGMAGSVSSVATLWPALAKGNAKREWHSLICPQRVTAARGDNLVQPGSAAQNGTGICDPTATIVRNSVDAKSDREIFLVTREAAALVTMAVTVADRKQAGRRSAVVHRRAQDSFLVRHLLARLPAQQLGAT
jgi:hypothetical protein